MGGRQRGAGGQRRRRRFATHNRRALGLGLELGLLGLLLRLLGGLLGLEGLKHLRGNSTAENARARGT